MDIDMEKSEQDDSILRQAPECTCGKLMWAEPDDLGKCYECTIKDYKKTIASIKRIVKNKQKIPFGCTHPDNDTFDEGWRVCSNLTKQAIVKTINN